LEVSSVQVDTRITDQVAVTKVDQEFFNPNAATLEGTFVFPVPQGAHLDKFTLEIDGKPVSAELLGAEKARRIYEDIVRKMKDPALLEYAGRDLFKVRIFPIEPHSKKRVSLTYTELLKADHGLVSYRLPLSAGKYSCKPVKRLGLSIRLETRNPLKTIYSPTHPIDVKRDGPRRATAAFERSENLSEADFALYFAPEKDEIGLNLLTHRTHGEEGYFLLLASPGVDVRESQVVMKDMVFVLDSSGSMAGKKLEQAKKALLFCIENLNAGDRFEILRFSTEVEPVFHRLADANPDNRERAAAFVKELRPIGGTAIDDALQKALALRPAKSEASASGLPAETAQGARPYLVIFLTDGLPTIGVTDESRIVAHVKERDDGRTRIFCFGIGTDVNTHLLDKITEQTRATSQYVLPEEDLEVKLSNFYAKIKEPVLSNPALELTGNIRVTKLYPSHLPDLFKGEQLVLVGRYSGEGPSAITISGTVNGQVRRFVYEAKFAQAEPESEFIPRLWATRRVGYLLDEIRLHGDNSELREEVTELARKYGIVTPYTAHLIVEDEARREVPEGMRTMRHLERDTELRREAAASWDSFKADRSGDSAVAGALSSSALRSAATAEEAARQSASSATMSRRYGLRGGGGGNAAALPPSAVPAPSTSGGSTPAPASYAETSRFAAGKTFYLNGTQWMDSALQKTTGAQRVRLEFNSKEYFDFARAHPKAAPWLALGPNVQFLLDGTVYEIHE
jgi:Ca-activated chloride channel family protein